MPTIEKTACLHHTNTEVRCDICIEGCPTSAITKKGKGLVINEYICIGCGICLAKCPSHSIGMRNFGENKIPKAVEGNEIVVFGCNYAEAEGNVMVPCLNGLHPELLAILFLHFRDKKFFFNLSKCSNCTIESKAYTFETSLQKCIDFLKDIDIESEHEVILNADKVPMITPRVMTRREFINTIKEGSINQATEILSSMWENNIDNSFSRRKLLIDSITKLDKEKKMRINGKNSLFSNYQINSNCDGCAYCEAICHYKAWRTKETEDTITLSHNVSLCRSCAQCIKSCPQKAIERDETNIPIDVLRALKVKMEKSSVKCKKCNMTIISNRTEDELCTNCVKQEEIRKSLFKNTEKIR